MTNRKRRKNKTLSKPILMAHALRDQPEIAEQLWKTAVSKCEELRCAISGNFEGLSKLTPAMRGSTLMFAVKEYGNDDPDLLAMLATAAILTTMEETERNRIGRPVAPFDREVPGVLRFPDDVPGLLAEHLLRKNTRLPKFAIRMLMKPTAG